MTKKPVFILLAALALLAVLIAVFIALGDAPEAPLAEESAPGIPLLRGERPLRIEVHGADYILLEQTGADGETEHLIEGLDDAVPLHTGLISAAFTAAQSLEANALIDGAGLPADYGLDEHAARVTFYYADGASAELRVGSPAPDGTSAYVLVDGAHAAASPDTVYAAAISSLEPFLLDAMSYVSPAVTQADTEGMRFASAVFSGVPSAAGGADADVLLEFVDSSLYVSGVERPAHPYKSYLATQSLFGLVADEVVAIGYDEHELLHYGLDRPYSSVYLHGASQGEITLHTSAPDAHGNVYFHRAELPVIYSVAAEKLPWLDMERFDFVDPRILTGNRDELASATLCIGGASYRWNTGADGTDKAYTFNGAPTRASDFEPFLDALFSGALTGFAQAADLPDSADAVAELTVTYTNGKSESLFLFPGPTRFHTVTYRDSPTSFAVSSTWLASVQKEAESLQSNLQ